MSPDKRFLSAEDCRNIVDRIRRMATGGGDTAVSIWSQWEGDVRWSRNRVSVAGDRRRTYVAVIRTVEGASGRMLTNQTDDVSLQSLVRAAEHALAYRETEVPEVQDPPQKHEYLDTPIWSDASFAQTADTRGDIATHVLASAEAAGMRSAGYIRLTAEGIAETASIRDPILYFPRTYAQCSMTIRNPTGTGSGWAGVSSYDWGRVGSDRIAEVALDKCVRSQNPVALEPGHYTAILEPQAVYDLINIVMNPTAPKFLSRGLAEGGRDGSTGEGPFFKKRTQDSYQEKTVLFGLSKLGDRIFDERITISQDPMNPETGTPPFRVTPGRQPNDPMRPVTWIKDGVLVNMETDYSYALSYWNEYEGFPNSGIFRMSGGTTTMDEMISTTKRGLIVTRFTNLIAGYVPAALYAGYTRDGLWLVENGKISKPVKNFRFNESPFFVFNNVEQLGVPVPVFSPGFPAVVPPVKVRDFNFSSLSNAV